KAACFSPSSTSARCCSPSCTAFWRCRATRRAARAASAAPASERDPPRMSDLFLGIADPEFWRNCGYALLAIGFLRVGAVPLRERRRRLQKELNLLFIAVVLAGLGVARFGNNALLSEAREAELELAKLTTPRTLMPDGQRRVASAVQKFAGQEFEGQVAPG